MIKSELKLRAAHRKVAEVRDDLALDDDAEGLRDLDSIANSSSYATVAERQGALERLRSTISPSQVRALEFLLDEHRRSAGQSARVKAEEAERKAQADAKYNASVAELGLDPREHGRARVLLFKNVDRVVHIEEDGRFRMRLLSEMFERGAATRAAVAAELGLPATANVGEVLCALDNVGLGDSRAARAVCGINNGLTIRGEMPPAAEIVADEVKPRLAERARATGARA
jgi:hypothetical protein